MACHISSTVELQHLKMYGSFIGDTSVSTFCVSALYAGGESAVTQEYFFFHTFLTSRNFI